MHTAFKIIMHSKLTTLDILEFTLQTNSSQSKSAYKKSCNLLVNKGSDQPSLLSLEAHCSIVVIAVAVVWEAYIAVVKVRSALIIPYSRLTEKFKQTVTARNRTCHRCEVVTD